MRIERTIVADRGAAEPISLGASLATGRKVAPDAISLLVMDHVEARSFFRRYDQEADPARKLSTALRLCKLLAAHMQVEEEIFYPASGEATGDEGMVRHAVEEHDQGKVLMAEILSGAVEGMTLDDRVHRLRDIIEHHVEEEETGFFPKVRGTGRLDLYDIGARVAARRLELLIEAVDRPLETEAMQTQTDLSVGTPVNMSETAIAPIDPQAARQMFVLGLKNAHALVVNGRTMLERQIERVESYPKVKARLQAHMPAEEAQRARIETILDDLGEGTSGLKDALSGMAANAGAMTHAAAHDEILKNSMADAAATQMKIAAYRSLIVMGEAAGEIEAIRALQKSLDEERSMAAWLEENLPGTVLMHLQLMSAGEQAKH